MNQSIGINAAMGRATPSHLSTQNISPEKREGQSFNMETALVEKRNHNKPFYASNRLNTTHTFVSNSAKVSRMNSLAYTIQKALHEYNKLTIEQEGQAISSLIGVDYYI